jgi:hypothetical protein
VVNVTSGYVELQQISRGAAGYSPLGGDICLLELWRLDTGIADIDVTPTSVTFPNTMKDYASEAVAFGVANPSTVVVNYSAAIEGSDASQFEIVGSASGSVQPGQQNSLSVRFVPDRLGPANAEVRITSNDPDKPLVVVPLTATAVDDPMPDIDRDGDVDLTDFGAFQACFNGPNRSPSTGCTSDADFDDDSDVDLGDFSQFQTCFNGPNRPPSCL